MTKKRQFDDVRATMQASSVSVSEIRKAIAFTAADRLFFTLLAGLITSVRMHVPELTLTVFDLGLDHEHVEWLRDQKVETITPQLSFGLGEEYRTPLSLSSLVRPYLRNYVPGYDYYLWLDSDVWLQDCGAISDLIAGSGKVGLAVVHERDPDYRFDVKLAAWAWKRATVAFGPMSALRQPWKRQINAGITSFHRDGSQWEFWERRFGQAIRKTGRIFPNEQFALNEIIYGDRAPAAVLDSPHNWICDRALPAWDDRNRRFVTPGKPHRNISILHLAGYAKSKSHEINTTEGGKVTKWLTFPDATDCPTATYALTRADIRYRVQKK